MHETKNISPKSYSRLLIIPILKRLLISQFPFWLCIITAAIIFIGAPHETKAAGCCTYPNSALTDYRYVEATDEAACRDIALQETGRTSGAIFHINKIVAPDGRSCIDSPQATSNQDNQEATKARVPILPQLQVSIPGFGNFTDVQCDEENPTCEIPWIAEYINALYKYSLTIIAVLAAVVLMIGGLIRLTAGGSRERIGQGNDFIKSGVFGIILAMSSYLILFLINPNLTILKSIPIAYIENIDLPEIDLSKTAEELNMSQGELDTLRGQNPYQDGCGNIERCRQYGNMRPPGLVQIAPEHGTGYLNAEVYEAFKKALACVNQKFTVSDGWRSAAGQIDVKRRKKDLAATPCCSNHGAGVAMDLKAPGYKSMSWDYNDSSGFKRCMNQNGLYAKLNTKKQNEPWHWSPTGR